MRRQYNQEEIIIKNAPTSNDLTEKSRRKFLDPVDGLFVRVVTENRRSELCSIEVDQEMILFSNIHVERPRGRTWVLELPLSDTNLVNQTELTTFMCYLASGYMKATVDNIWSYFLLACVFEVDVFIAEMMKYELPLAESPEIVSCCLGAFYQFLQPIHADVHREELTFFQWMVRNNPNSFRMADLARNPIERVLIEILECKAKSGDLPMSELKSLEYGLKNYYKNKNREDDFPRTLQTILPRDYLSVEAIEYFREILYPDEREFTAMLMNLRECLLKKQTDIEAKKRKLKQALDAKKAEVEKCTKEYYTAELEAVLEQDRRVNPHRYMKAVEPNRNPRVSEPARRPDPPPSPPRNQGWEKMEQESQPRSKKSKKNKHKNEDEDKQLATAMKLSLEESEKHQPIKIRPPPPKRQPHNRKAVCNMKERVPMQCGCQLCLGCLVNFYFERTESMDFNALLSWDMCQNLKMPVDCWNCRKNLTRRDFQEINDRRVI